jgi:glycosyltransferase involved in cell wall biosynthesis
MACYNADRWLEEAIRSVLEQTFGGFELVVVDDGSTDGTIGIVREFARRDDRIALLMKPHSGLSDSLNAGVSRARGTWIARLDADDVAERRRLETQLSFLRTRPDVVLLGSGATEIDELGRAVMIHRYPRSHGRLLRNLERGMRFFAHSSAIIRRESLEEVGGYRSEFRKAQDTDLWFRLGERGSVACLGECLVRIRTHSGQLSYSDEGWSQLAEAIGATVTHFLRGQGSPDPVEALGGAAFGEFMNWVSRRIDAAEVPKKRQVWLDARTEFAASASRLRGLGRFGARLLQSRHIGSLLKEKYFGSSLAERLAREWAQVERERANAGLTGGGLPGDGGSGGR